MPLQELLDLVQKHPGLLRRPIIMDEKDGDTTISQIFGSEQYPNCILIDFFHFHLWSSLSYLNESDANASPLNIANAGIGNDLADYIRKQITGENEKIRRQKPALANDGDGVSGYLKEDPEAQYRYVVSFADFEDFIQLAKAFNYDSTVSNLYHLDGKYYLELIFFADQMEVADV